MRNFGMISSVLFAVSGCCTLGYSLKPSQVSGLTVDETQSLTGTSISIKGLAMDSTYGPSQIENECQGDSMRISVKMKWRKRPDFNFQFVIPDGVYKVVWDDICIWEKGKYLTLNGNVNPDYAVRMSKEFLNWISGTNCMTHADETRFFGNSLTGDKGQDFQQRVSDSALSKMLRQKSESVFSLLKNGIFSYVPACAGNSSIGASHGYVIVLGQKKDVLCLCIRPCGKCNQKIDLADSSFNGVGLPLLLGFSPGELDAP